MKEYPLDLNTLGDLDNEEVCGVYTKGHHDFDAFRTALANDAPPGQRGVFPVTSVEWD